MQVEIRCEHVWEENLLYGCAASLLHDGRVLQHGGLKLVEHGGREGLEGGEAGEEGEAGPGGGAGRLRHQAGGEQAGAGEGKESGPAGRILRHPHPRPTTSNQQTYTLQ